jgi:hypothetical protein
MLPYFNNMYIISVSVKHYDETTYTESTKSGATGKF